MSGNGQDRMRPEPVEGHSSGASTSSARISSGNGQSAPKAPERPKYGPPTGGGGGRIRNSRSLAPILHVGGPSSGRRSSSAPMRLATMCSTA